MDTTSQTEIKLVPLPKRPIPRLFRVFALHSAAVLIVGILGWLFADLLWRTGWSTSRTILVCLFILLVWYAALGCVSAIAGFLSMVFQDQQTITRTKPYNNVSLRNTPTALLFPIYNEDASKVFARIKTVYQSLHRLGHLEHFDFFVLSDTDDPDIWLLEERIWFDTIKELNALGKIFYRRRFTNEGKKSGNIRDFLSLWGKRYKYFIVFDADSLMQGETLVSLVKLMEIHPEVGLIQTVPSIVNATTLFGRIQQFANRLYAPIFIAGLNFWAQGFGNYWGHNAIIRTEPFMKYCDLPKLPGRKPFGGHILSHDFVEAALLLKENWQVWFAYELTGSYEETPQNMLGNAARDRRWCQGNLQHSMLVFAKGLRGISRIHLILGIFGYLCSPLWLAFLLVYNWIRISYVRSGLSEIVVHPFTPYLNLTANQHAFLIFALCMGIILFPKLLAIAYLLINPQVREQFGGLAKAISSVIIETVFSALVAPINMLWHSWFVITNLFGMTVSWIPIRRSAIQVRFLEAVPALLPHTVIGLIWGYIIWKYDRVAFWWFLPIFIGLTISIPLCILSSKPDLGVALRKLGLLLTPEEISPPEEIVKVNQLSAMTQEWPKSAGIYLAILDPYLNALHICLLKEKFLNPIYAQQMAELGIGQPSIQTLATRLMREGPDNLSREEKLLILSDPDALNRLHQEIWLCVTQPLHKSWTEFIRNKWVTL